MMNINAFEEEYIKNIKNLDLIFIIKNKKISFNFAINYLLNSEYQKDKDEENISLDMIYCYQPHLRDEINEYIKE